MISFWYLAMIFQQADFVRAKASSLDHPNQDDMVAAPGDGQVVGLLCSI